jgi:hypothetical protein
VLLTLSNFNNRDSAVAFHLWGFMGEAANAVANANANLPKDNFQLEDGRDEMNLAEFPLAALADRVPDNQKTLAFEDEIWDSGKAKMITRRLTISASDKYGLPTSLDDEVILGLIQLTKQNRFADRKVSFSRYQLIQILGWRHEGRSYGRLEKSLKRWLGVTLYYDKAWWDKDEQSWVDENFHILDQVTLYDQERRLNKLRRDKSELPLSSFTWNDVVFRSFMAGYLKSLDFTVFRGLKHAAAKRMYRFLDKRFYHKPSWDFDLLEFACAHVGASRNYDTGQMKRRLLPAITELEEVGFLTPLAADQRFVKLAPGKWRIIFVRKEAPQIISSDAVPNRELVDKLVARGVTLSVAAELVRTYDGEKIKKQIECFDRRLNTSAQQALRNPAGYLVKAIRGNFVSMGAIKSIAPPVRPKRSGDPKAETRAATNSIDTKIADYLGSLTPAELSEVEARALQGADALVFDGYRRSQTTGGVTYAAYRQMLLEREARRLLAMKSETPV